MLYSPIRTEYRALVVQMSVLIAATVHVSVRARERAQVRRRRSSSVIQRLLS